MSNNKYYWIRYDLRVIPQREVYIQQCVSDLHPFDWLKRLKMLSSSERNLVDWKEISEEEYNKGKSVIGIG